MGAGAVDGVDLWGCRERVGAGWQAAADRGSGVSSGDESRYRILPRGADGLNDARVETYKNFQQFFDALREALIQNSPNDDNALALDGTETAFEKYRASACDALVRVYDVGTVKHPGAAEPSSKTRCLITLTRSRMRDLRDMYASTL
jgi:uncharacterized protein YecT (DUF1311 family)